MFKNIKDIVIEESWEQVAKIFNLTFLSNMLASVGLAITGLLDWINSYASAFGVLIGFLTFSLNIYFKFMWNQAIKSKESQKPDLLKPTLDDEDTTE